MIGYFGNGVLVFRLGELLKAYSISRNSDIKTTNLIGTVILERSLDLLMVLTNIFDITSLVSISHIKYSIK